MKHFIVFLLFALYSGNAICQQYRLIYDESSLPELYNEVAVYAQIQKGDRYINLPANKYRLTTNEGNFRNGILTIDRNKLLHNNGLVNFTVLMQGKSMPLLLQLPVLKNIRYNLYTDSIKPILNYYVNIEGEFSSGRILPLDSNTILISASQGNMKGMEWVAPAKRNFDKVIFTATVKGMPHMSISKTVYLKQYIDPRDALDYQDASEEEIIKQKRRK